MLDHSVDDIRISLGKLFCDSWRVTGKQQDSAADHPIGILQGSGQDDLPAVAGSPGGSQMSIPETGPLRHPVLIPFVKQ